MKMRLAGRRFALVLCLNAIACRDDANPQLMVAASEPIVALPSADMAPWRSSGGPLAPPVCGDGVVDGTEQCDNGVLNGTAGNCCSATCTAIANGTMCNGSNLCFQTYQCQNGSCVGSNAVICTPHDQCHVAGVCNPATGVCSSPNASDGTACTGANACNRTNTCQGGACVGSNPVVCAPLDDCHVAGVCNPATGICSNPEEVDGTPCKTASACFAARSCMHGTCVGTNPVVCAALDECHVAGSCDTDGGVCSNPTKPNGAPCTGGVCVAGSCVASTADAGADSGVETDGGQAIDAADAADASPSGTTTSDGGCGCRTVAAERTGSSSAVFVFAALATLARRRRR